MTLLSWSETVSEIAHMASPNKFSALETELFTVAGGDGDSQPNSSTSALESQWPAKWINTAAFSTLPSKEAILFTPKKGKARTIADIEQHLKQKEGLLLDMDSMGALNQWGAYQLINGRVLDTGRQELWRAADKAVLCCGFTFPSSLAIFIQASFIFPYITMPTGA